MGYTRAERLSHFSGAFQNAFILYDRKILLMEKNSPIKQDRCVSKPDRQSETVLPFVSVVYDRVRTRWMVPMLSRSILQLSKAILTPCEVGGRHIHPHLVVTLSTFQNI